MFDAALVEKVGEAAHQHFADTLENQFRRLLTDGFRHAPRQADNAVRDHLRRIYRQRHHETAVGADSLQRLQEHAERDGYRVELVARREEAQILLAEIVVEANLTNREWAVIELRLEELTQATVAKQLRISQPRVAQLERSAMRKLQARVRG
jgi:RNA polymerase sigma factor (sigma-70 family)